MTLRIQKYSLIDKIVNYCNVNKNINNNLLALAIKQQFIKLQISEPSSKQKPRKNTEVCKKK